MKFALFAGVFRDRTLDEMIAAARRWSYDGVELRTHHSCNIPADVTPAEMERVKGLLEEAEIEFPNYYNCGGGYATLSDEECQVQLDGLKRYAEIANYFGCQFVTQGPGGRSPELPDEVFRHAATWLAKAADFLADHGLKLISEIHNNGLIESAPASVKLAEMVNRDNFGYIHDGSNMMISGREWKGEAIRSLGEKIFYVHVKDMGVALPGEPKAIQIKEQWWKYNLLGDGNVHFEQVFADLQSIGFEGYLSFECNMPAPGEVVAEHEIKMARRMLQHGSCI